VKRH